MNDIVTGVMEEKSRVRIQVNGERVFWLSAAAYGEKPLVLNEAIDLPAFEEWLLPKQYPEALSKAVSFLALRARSRREVEQKLQSRGYMDRTVELVLFKLEKEKLLDDEAFARDWAVARTHRQLGKARILQELRQKGIPRALAEKACADLPGEEQEEQAARLADKLLRRYGGEPEDAKTIQKILAALGRRGFSYEEASDALQAAISRAREE